MVLQKTMAQAAYDGAASSMLETMLTLKRVLDLKTPFDFGNALYSGRMIFLGEGNLSFACAVANRLGRRASRVIATTFEEGVLHDDETRANAKNLRYLGAKVRFGVDAGRCDSEFPFGSVDLAVFQFPNVGSRRPLYRRNPNHILVKRFLTSVRNVLSKNGQVAITVVNSSHYDGAFAMDEVATKTGFEKPLAHPFFMEDFSGYSHRKTKLDGKPAIEHDDELVTFVFRPKVRRT